MFLGRAALFARISSEVWWFPVEVRQPLYLSSVCHSFPASNNEKPMNESSACLFGGAASVI